MGTHRCDPDQFEPINILNPDKVALNGGISAGLDLMRRRMHAVVRERAFAESASVVEIDRGALGNEAAAIGAALFVRDQAGGRKEAR